MHNLSVIMTTYNENLKFLKTCIDSILNQSYEGFEFIIVIEPDEKNSDFLMDVADSDKRVVIIKNESKLGISGSRNKAINASSGEYIAFIDSDDYCNLMRFEKQINFLENNPDISVIGANMHIVDEENNIIGKREYPELHEAIKQRFLLIDSVANPTVMLRSEDIKEVGLFDNGFVKSEDFELWLRFLAGGKKMHNLQEALVYYRILSAHNEKRGSLHWKNNYTARKKYAKYIWPFHLRILSLIFYFIVSNIPETYLNGLLRLGVVNKVKNISVPR